MGVIDLCSHTFGHTLSLSLCVCGVVQFIWYRLSALLCHTEAICLHSVMNCFGLSVFKMAALVSSPREVFSEAVKAVLEAWPVLQVPSATAVFLPNKSPLYHIGEMFKETGRVE